MTFDYKKNEHKMGKHVVQVINNIAKSMNPTRFNLASVRTSWTVVPYQSTHNTGDTIMGTSPGNSVVNKYLQSWDCHNLFVMGSSVFPQRRVQSNRPRRRAHVLGGRCDQESLCEKSRHAGVGGAHTDTRAR